MAMALRPRLSPSSMASRYAVHSLMRLGDGEKAPTSSRWADRRWGVTSESVITSLAGFELACLFVEGFSRLVLGWPSVSGITAMAGFSTPKSVITSLAGFGARRPQPLGGRTAIPAAFRY